MHNCFHKVFVYIMVFALKSYHEYKNPYTYLETTSVYLMPLTVYVKYTDLCNDKKVVLPRASELVYVPSMQHISALPGS